MTKDKFWKICKVFLAVMAFVIATVSAVYVAADLDQRGGAFNLILSKFAIMLCICTIVDGFERFHVSKTTYFKGKVHIALLVLNVWVISHAVVLLFDINWIGAVAFLLAAIFCCYQFVQYAVAESDNEYMSDKLTKELNDKQKELEGAKHSAESYKTQIEQLTNRLDAALTDAKECHDEINRLNGEYGKAEENIKDLNAKIEQLTKELEAVKNERSALKSKYDKQSNDLQSKMNDIDKLSEQLNKANAELNETKTKLGELAQKNKLLNEVNNGLVDDKAKLQDKVDNLSKRLETSEAGRNDAIKECNATKAKLSKVQNELDILKQESKTKIDKLTAEFNKLKESYDTLIDKQADEKIDIDEYKALKAFKAKYEAKQAKKSTAKKSTKQTKK